jgi:4-hydroxy-3-polyprenylbenzoate decarboxylase
VNPEQDVIVAMSGASGSVYALRLVSVLTDAALRVHLTLTDGASRVLAVETPHRTDSRRPKPEDLGLDRDKVRVYSIDNVAAPFASGTFLHRGMVVVPCSMGTVGRLAHGVSTNLLERAADVCLKERRRLILVPRETPLHTLHLENLLSLARAGATVLPAMPGFYRKPESIDDLVDSVVGKILDHLGIEHGIATRWGTKQ